MPEDTLARLWPAIIALMRHNMAFTGLYQSPVLMHPVDRAANDCADKTREIERARKRRRRPAATRAANPGIRATAS
jgi:hypothetical protein